MRRFIGAAQGFSLSRSLPFSSKVALRRPSNIAHTSSSLATSVIAAAAAAVRSRRHRSLLVLRRSLLVRRFLSSSARISSLKH
jgi:hypothetical protein